MSSTAAFYRYEEQDVTIVSGVMVDPHEAMATLAHEFTHYLQDRAGQLEALRGERVSTDEYVARQAVIEGDAMLTSLRTSVAMRGGQLASDRWPELLGAIEEEVTKQAHDAESPVVAGMSLLPYTIGLDALTAAWESGGHSAVAAFFDQPPRSARDWLDERALGGAPDWPERPALQCYPPLAPQGYELLFTDSLGLLGAFALLARDDRASIMAASDLRNDSMAVYADKSAETTDTLGVHVVWRLDFERDAAAERFAELISGTGLAISRSGAELTIHVSSDPNAPAFSEEQLAQCATREHLEASVQDDESAAASIGLEKLLRQRLGRAGL